MEKVGDSQLSSEEPVSSTSKEMMKERQIVALKVEAESAEISLEKIKGVLEKLRETGDIDAWWEETDGTVTVLGYNLDPEKLRMELENEAGDAIKSITDLTNNIIHSGSGSGSGSDSDLTGLCNSDEEEAHYESGKIPRMPILEFGDRRTEILYHGEKPMEYSNNRRRRWWSWSCGLMADNREMGDAGGSEFPKIPTAEVFDNHRTQFQSNVSKYSIL